jgi:hypothetical protein
MAPRKRQKHHANVKGRRSPGRPPNVYRFRVVIRDASGVEIARLVRNGLGQTARQDVQRQVRNWLAGLTAHVDYEPLPE